MFLSRLLHVQEFFLNILRESIFEEILNFRLSSSYAIGGSHISLHFSWVRLCSIRTAVAEMSTIIPHIQHPTHPIAPFIFISTFHSGGESFFIFELKRARRYSFLFAFSPKRYLKHIPPLFISGNALISRFAWHPFITHRSMSPPGRASATPHHAARHHGHTRSGLFQYRLAHE